MPDSLPPVSSNDGHDLDYAALGSRVVATDPFPHLVVANFVPPARLAAVMTTMPDIANGGSYPPSALRLKGAAAALIDELEGPRLRDAVATCFGLDLRESRTMLTVRGRTRERDGRIHTDSTAKLVTILLYLNPADASWAGQDGCLRLLRGPDDLEDYAVEVPPVDGTLLVFPNGPTTYHGHRPFVGRRHAIQLNYMAAGAKARQEIRRHKLSAMVKRLIPA